MNDETPQLQNEKKMAWYRGLSRYQWLIVIIASMGWMFDTMDQQFFNLGRGPAMKDVTGYAPVVTGLEYVKEQSVKLQDSYTAEELDLLVEQELINEAQKKEILTGKNGETKEKVTRKEVAQVIGEQILAPKYRKLAQDDLEPFEQETFTEQDLNQLMEKEIVSSISAEEWLAKHPSGQIPREQMAFYIGREEANAQADVAGDQATMIFVFGWAFGGLLFGWIGDALGRAKTMALTILIYALFTGLNGLAQTELQFHVLRFLTALGVGGEFAAGAALVAESMPERSRAAALGTVQALSAVGNMMGAGLAIFIMPVLGWRWLFFVGAIPGIVAVFVFLLIHEPEKWKEARKKWLEERKAGKTQKKAAYAGILQDSRWRKRAIIGLILGIVGVGGLWGVGFFKPELDRLIGEKYGMAPEAKERMTNIAFLLQNFGAFFGMATYTALALRIGRKFAFGFFFVIAFFIVSYTFLFSDTMAEVYILAPLVGFATLGPFGGFAIYFPELFPTRLRATGVGICYNVGRFGAALVPGIKGGLKGLFMSGALMIPFLPAATGDATLAIRYGSFLMLFIYLVGLITLIWAPETKDQPLPEE